jgi:hypothetical protein
VGGKGGGGGRGEGWTKPCMHIWIIKEKWKKKKVSLLDRINYFQRLQMHQFSYKVHFLFLLCILFSVNCYTFIHICIHCLGHLSPLPPTPSPPPCFQAEPVLFYWRENIRDNKKDIAFLLAWDKDSYTERFLALLPCTCVWRPKLVHLYQTSSLHPDHLPIVTSASLRLLYP